MGRLQRKKHPGKKKDKKKGVDIAASSQLNRDVPAKKTASISGSLLETKKQVLPQKKPSGISKLSIVRQNISILDKGLQFLREVKVELKKVTWPTRKQTIGSTAVVIILVMIISLFLGVVDIGLSSLVSVFIQ
ncbi:MAG: preprotein translocase subunit SecE [Desulfobacteraceae bacterium Eth-SRB1]|nr:MAG: preprotein translocase subunit SecE [Desulfobacteraceae bacterium Eth-SRB1]